MTDYVYNPAFEGQFKKHYKTILKGVHYKKEDFETVYRQLLQDEPLEPHYNDHALVNRKPERELHIKPDWLLIYKYDGKFIRFIDTGSHSDLFK
jgi:mRNA interferase YafQ